MATFFGALLSVTGGLLIVSSPVVFMARRRGRNGLAIKFSLAAMAIGLFFAFVAVGSRRLVDSCEAAGGTSCLDVGSTGLRFLVVLIYVIASAAATYTLARQ